MHGNLCDYKVVEEEEQEEEEEEEVEIRDPAREITALTKQSIHA
jgi:hypothetical protein